jgi:hypothetical protein
MDANKLIDEIFTSFECKERFNDLANDIVFKKWADPENLIFMSVIGMLQTMIAEDRLKEVDVLFRSAFPDYYLDIKMDY